MTEILKTKKTQAMSSLKVKALKVTAVMFFSDDIYYGRDKYIFYGKFKENTYDEILADEDYSTFWVEDWNIMLPVKRLNLFGFKPLFYLYEGDKYVTVQPNHSQSVC
ncbi:MAG: hypothetical protein LUD77_06445 [Clostridiales bacterium]|nr:hypothetical protein [Clostridiales bacterium]